MTATPDAHDRPRWADVPYTRTYRSLSVDHPTVYGDDRLLAWWVRLLDVADAIWPMLAPVPRGVPDDVLTALVADEVIDVEADRFRFHGLDAERNGRVSRGYHGGKVRAATAARDSLGRLLAKDAGADAGHSRSDAGADAGADAGPAMPVPTLVTNAGRPATQRTEPSNRDASPSLRSGLASSSRSITHARVAASARARPDPSPEDIDCDDYVGHKASRQWWGEDIGWRCQICEKRRADEGPSFRERIARYSGDAGF